ncbi:hypothetical protein JOF53_003912 [Crossiella equi]|uniref:Uncharacterized protein n=1 Tax=Crossiella equi TaxID=130796 RepID=A0ABS5AEM5_9PSEU|nr:hypothetical protein [Crossiella equi]MBP2475040.1 hypothetical protein [Crossiella equi]
MSKNERHADRIDPTWPEGPSEKEHAVSELVSHLQGAQSPYGEVTFPVEAVPYTHPTTVINR